MTDIQTLDDALTEAVTEVNIASPPPVVRKLPPFVQHAEQCANALVEAFEIAVNDAKTKLEEAKIKAAAIVADAKEKGDILASYNEGLDQMSSSIVKAFDTFNSNPKQGNGSADSAGIER